MSESLIFGSFTEGAVTWFNKKVEEKQKSQVNSANPGAQVGSSDKPKPSDSSEIRKDNKLANGNPKIVKKTSSNGAAATASTPAIKSNGSSSNGNKEANSKKNALVAIKSNGSSSNGNKEANSEKNAPVAIKSNGSSSTGNKEANSKKNAPVVLIRDVLPRGLMNMGNLRFLNAILQALLYCSPFVALLQGLKSRKISKVVYPTLSSFVDFIGEFDVPKGANSKMQRLEAVWSFSPTMLLPVLKKFTKISAKPIKEDAQEFLSFIMDQMHSELLKLNKEQSDTNGNSSSLVSESEDEGWETIVRKNKPAVTILQDFVPSELTSIFGGELSSRVKAKGIKPSVTTEPFLFLHLDIWQRDILSIEDALNSLCSIETLDEYSVSTTEKDAVVAATKSIKIKSLPKILILHLMRFSYDGRESTKLYKPVSFPLEMVLSRDLLVPSVSESEGRKYQLVSTVTHHGSNASRGHYTADVCYTNGQWLRFNNAVVTAVNRNQVLQNQAYLLFYKQL